MIEIKGEELEKTKEYMRLAVDEAKNSRCRKSKRGVVIIKEDEVVGSGYNKPTLERLCDPCIRENIKDHSKPHFCSANHAEQVAIIDAFRKGNLISGSTMYHIKVEDGKGVPSGSPSCTICSKMIWEAGISYVVLLEEVNGRKVYNKYNASEFNELSFDYFTKVSYSIEDLMKQFNEIENKCIAMPMLEGILYKWIHKLENEYIVSDLRKPEELNNDFNCVFWGREISISRHYIDFGMLNNFIIKGEEARKLMLNFEEFIKNQKFEDLIKEKEKL